MGVNRVADLDINEDLPFQRKEWIAERIGWVAGLIILALALIGLFGGGPLAMATVSDDSDTLSVEYDRIVRKLSPTDLAISVPAEQPEVSLWIDRSFLDRVTVEGVAPEPQEVVAGGGRVVYRFAVEPSGTPVVIRFSFEHEHMGLIDTRLGLIDGPALAFRTLVLP